MDDEFDFITRRNERAQEEARRVQTEHEKEQYTSSRARKFCGALTRVTSADEATVGTKINVVEITKKNDTRLSVTANPDDTFNIDYHLPGVSNLVNQNRNKNLTTAAAIDAVDKWLKQLN
jgi:hypothetical protein